VAIGASDCELIRNGLVAQRFNTWTSLGYVVAGGVIAVWQRRSAASASALVFAGLVALEGVGSVAFHALTNGPARWLHDDAILGALGFVAAYEVALLLRRPPDRPAVTVGLGVFVVMGTVLAAWPGATNVALLLLVVTALAAYLARRGRDHRGPDRRDLPFTVLTVVTVGAFLLGRTGSPTCRPGSWFQFHGVWHLGTAVMAAFWAIATIRRRAGTISSVRSRRQGSRPHGSRGPLRPDDPILMAPPDGRGGREAT